MTEFFAACLAFPTALYSILLSVVLLYWGFVIVGVFDIDLLDVDGDGVLDSIGDSAADGVGGLLAAGKGAGEGAAEAATEAAGAGAGEAAGKALAEGGGGALAGLMTALNLRRAPATVVISFIVLFGWTLSLVAMDLLGGLAAAIPGGGWLVGAAVGFGALVTAVPLTSLAISPLGRFFATHSARGRRELVGHLCVISTGRVDARFGQAYCRMGTDDLLIPVRCDRPNALAKGREALVVDYDEARQAFVVEPVDP